ncbi:MAG: acyl-CoA dehydrogenase family protein [Butyricicoccaceae bacterium]
MWYYRRYLSAHTSLCCDPIQTFGTEEQKQKYLVPLAKGEKLGAFGLTEPGAGTDAQGQQTKAVLDGDEWVLNGSKVFITNGKEADIYVIIAVTGVVEVRAERKRDLCIYRRERNSGLHLRYQREEDGYPWICYIRADLLQIAVSEENLLGQQGKGFTSLCIPWMADVSVSLPRHLVLQRALLRELLIM